MSDCRINQKVIQEDMRIVAGIIEEMLKTMYGQRMGFCLLSMPFGQPDDLTRADCIGNVEREDMIKMMRGIAKHLENNEDAKVSQNG